MIDYTATYQQHFSKNYLYVYFDCGALLPDKQLEMRSFFQSFLRSKDCIGTLNVYKSNFNGLLLMHQDVYLQLRGAA